MVTCHVDLKSVYCYEITLTLTLMARSVACKNADSCMGLGIVLWLQYEWHIIGSFLGKGVKLIYLQEC